MEIRVCKRKKIAISDLKVGQLYRRDVSDFHTWIYMKIDDDISVNIATGKTFYHGESDTGYLVKGYFQEVE